jgi:serine/threonine protein kinase
MIVSQTKMFIRGKSGTKREIMLDLNSSIGSGGEGDIYRDPSNPNLVIKIFKLSAAAKGEKEAKLKAMIANPPQVLQSTQTGGTVVCLSWPEGMIYDAAGVFIGYSMPYLDTSNMVKLTEILNQRLREKENLRGHSETDYKFRIVVAINLANVLQYLHGCGYSVIDLKPDNIFVNKTMGLVSFLDCDSFRVQVNGQVFPANVGTPEYLAPECNDITKAGITTDLFAIGVILSQLINNDLHPSTGVVIHPVNAPDSLVGRLSQGIVTVNEQCVMTPHAKSIEAFLPKDILLMFRQSLLAEPAQRPSAMEWRIKLTELLDHRLKPCPKGVKEHTAFESGCPWCKSFNSMQRVAQPIASTTSTTSILISHQPKVSQVSLSAAQAAKLYRQMCAQWPSAHFSNRHPLPSWVTHYWLALTISVLGTGMRQLFGDAVLFSESYSLRWTQSCLNFPLAAAIGAWLVDVFISKKVPSHQTTLQGGGMNVGWRVGQLVVTYLIISMLSVGFFGLSAGFFSAKSLSLFGSYKYLDVYWFLFEKAKAEFIIYAFSLISLYFGIQSPSLLKRDSIVGFTYALVCASVFGIAYLGVKNY